MIVSGASSLSDALDKYKALVDKLRDLSTESLDSAIQIDVQLKEVWADLEERERAEAESYWRVCASARNIPIELN